VRKAALPILRRRFVPLILLVLLAGLLYELLLSPANGGHLGVGCQPVPQEDRDLLDLIF